MSGLSALDSLYTTWSADYEIKSNFVFSSSFPEIQPTYADFPAELSPILIKALKLKGIENLYSHQRASWDQAARFENLVIQSGTASGKSLCYLLPILNSMIIDPHSRALLLFPTKALAQDQMNKINDLLSELSGVKIIASAYDGDTPTVKRNTIRENTNIVVTNPDMLHLGILPHHTKWMDFLKNLRFIVLDEIHTYRGVFGSHVANVLRRLERISKHYQSQPQFFMTSATIGNADELASRLTGKQVTILSEDGSEHGSRKFMIYNPPLSNPDLGIRKSAIMETVRLSSPILQNQLQTIVFSRTRRYFDLILSSFQNYF
jgi:DEAD/DEAH box helicase domain-containing protein